MSLIIADRVLEASTTTGTGVFTLTGASLGFRSFASVCSVADTVWYYIEGVTAFGVPSGEYEYGLGTYSGANQITRTTVRGSSNGGSPVNFSAGTKLVGIAPQAPSTVAVQTEWRSLLAIPSVPAGTVIDYAANTPPTGYLKANGAAVNRTTYADLFAAIGTTFGVGDGSTTFNVPDLRGEFVRGWDDARGVDSGRVFGSSQVHAVMDHSHKSNKTLDGASLPYGGGVFDVMAEGGTVDESAVTGLITSTYAANRGAETRPRNIALLKCIKY